MTALRDALRDRVPAIASVILVAIIVSRLELYEVLDWHLDQSYARQILQGLNPYDLAVAPRPVSAFPLSLPLAWIDGEIFSYAVGAFAVVAVSLAAVRVAGWNEWLQVPIALILTQTTAVSLSTRVGNGGMLVSGLVAMAWISRSAWPVTIATALRIYPGAWMFVVGWRKVLAGVTVLMVVGLALVPDPLGMLTGLSENSETFVYHTGNASLAAFAARLGGPWQLVSYLTIVVGMVGAWWAGRFDFDKGMAIGAVLAVTMPTVAWPSYHLILVPVAAWLCAQGRWWVLLAFVSWFTFAWRGGDLYLISAFVVAAAVWTQKSPLAQGKGEGADLCSTGGITSR